VVVVVGGGGGVDVLRLASKLLSHLVLKPHTTLFKSSMSVFSTHPLSSCQPTPQTHSHPTDTHTVRVPNVYHVGLLPGSRGAFIVMDYLNLQGAGDQAELGRQMARMHLAPPTVGVLVGVWSSGSCVIASVI